MTETANELIVGDPTPEDSFPPQWEYVVAPSIRNVLKCSRRSGKTEAKIRKANRAVVRALRVLYVGKVLRNMRHQFWIPFKDRLSRFGVSYKTDERDHVLRPEGGGMLMGISADDSKDIEKGRGYEWDLVMIDEAQSFPDDVLEPLIDMIVIPTLIKTGGTLDLGGTPPDPRKGDSIRGYFVRLIRQAEGHAPDCDNVKNPAKVTRCGCDLTAKRDPRKGWHLFQWTMFDNPFIPQENIHEAYAARGIGPGHPIWEAEVMGRIVNDPGNRVYPFDPERNSYREIP